MNTELEDAIVDTLRPRAAGAVDVEAVRTTAVRRGKRLRTVRLTVATAGLAVLTGATAAIVPVLKHDGGGPVEQSGAPTAREVALPESDAPGALVRPGIVGTDPTSLHFGVDTAGMKVTGLSASVRDGVEEVRLWTSDLDHFNHWYRLARQPDPPARAGSPVAVRTEQVSIGGRAGTARLWPDEVSSDRNGPAKPTWSVDWQPVDGLYAQVRAFTDDLAEIVRDAEAMLLDRSQRCVAPLRMEPAPAGLTVTGCGVDLGHIFPWTMSDVVLTRADGVEFEVGVGHISMDDDFVFEPDQQVGGRPAQLIRYPAMSEHGQGSLLHVPIGPGINLSVRDHRVDADEADILAVARALVLSPDLTDLATWPVRTIG